MDRAQGIVEGQLPGIRIAGHPDPEAQKEGPLRACSQRACSGRTGPSETAGKRLFVETENQLCGRTAIHDRLTRFDLWIIAPIGDGIH